MLTRIFVITVIVSLVAPVPDESETADQALKQLKGNWVAVSAENRGEPLLDFELKALRFRFTENKLTIQWPAKEVGLTFTVDPAKKPKQINTLSLDPNFPQRISQGIYKFEDGFLWICTNTRGTNDRPVDYKTTRASGYAMYKLKREAP